MPATSETEYGRRWCRAQGGAAPSVVRRRRTRGGDGRRHLAFDDPDPVLTLTYEPAERLAHGSGRPTGVVTSVSEEGLELRGTPSPPCPRGEPRREVRLGLNPATAGGPPPPLPRL